MEIAVKNIVALQTKRIFEDGKKSNDSLIGKYDTDTGLYVNKKLIKGGGKLGVPRGKPYAKVITRGKNKGKKKEIKGRTKFTTGKKAGQNHKLNYVSSYYELRKILQKKVDKVNLVFNNDLFMDFANGKMNDPKPNKITPLWYTTSFKREINIKKREGLEEKYGTIFNLTKKEKEEFYRTLEFNIQKARAEFK